MRLLPLALLVASCSSTPECPVLAAACPASCPIVQMREVNVDQKCQSIPAERPCAAEDPRPAVTSCCASATGKLYAVVGFPSCALSGFRRCTAEEAALESATAVACK